MALELWASLYGQPLADGPILSVLGGTVIMSQINQFETSSVVLAASDARAVLCLQPYTLLEIVQEGLGTIGYGYILNPEQQVSENDDSTITLTLAPVTVELTWRTTDRGWTAETLLSVVASRLGAWAPIDLARGLPGWAGVLPDPADDLLVGVNIDGATVLDAFLSTGKQFDRFARLGVNPDHSPRRLLEMGQFGAAPTVVLTSANGGDADALAGNSLVQLVATVDWRPADVSNLVNTCTPFGGGAGDSLVTLERLWRIINDPSHPDFGRFGTDAQAIARSNRARVASGVNGVSIDGASLVHTADYAGVVVAAMPSGSNLTVNLANLTGADGVSVWAQVVYNGIVGYVIQNALQFSLFPEYDPNYPISDPLNPPTQAFQWYTTPPGATVPVPLPAGHTVVVGPRAADGTVVLTELDALGHPVVGAAPALFQGAYDTRRVTLDGHDDYVVYDAQSYALYGHKEGVFVDSALNYADKSPANQELTERALYIEAISNFKRFAHPHRMFTCTTPGTGYPTRAGDLITVDYQRVSGGDGGPLGGSAVVELDVREDLRVMKVERAFGTASAADDGGAVDTYTLSNLGRYDQDDTTQQASTARNLVAVQKSVGTSIAPLAVNDRGNVDALHPLVTHISVPRALYRWQRCNLRVDFQPYTATIATATNPAGTPIIAADVEVSLATPAGLTAQTAGLAAMPLHGHQFPLLALSAQAPTAASHWVGVVGSGDTELTAAGVASGTRVQTGTQVAPTDFTPSNHTHPVAAAGATVAHITAGQRIAALPQHTHPLDQHIPDGPLPVSCTVDINGSFLSSGLALLSGTRDTSGAFTSAFEVDDISGLLNALTGDLTVTLHAGTGAGNPFGTGMFVLSMTLFGEFGGLSSTIRAA